MCSAPLMKVMGYCEGGSLEAWLEHVASGFWERWKLVQDVAAGLEHLHSHDIVHRDLAARNVLVTGDGVAVLADCGRSRRVAEDGGEVATLTFGPLRPRRCGHERVTCLRSGWWCSKWSRGRSRGRGLSAREAGTSGRCSRRGRRRK